MTGDEIARGKFITLFVAFMLMCFDLLIFIWNLVYLLKKR